MTMTAGPSALPGLGLEGRHEFELPTQYARLIDIASAAPDESRTHNEFGFRVIGNQFKAVFTHFENTLRLWNIDYHQRESERGPALTLVWTSVERRRYISKLYEFAECSVNLGHGYHISPVLRVTNLRDDVTCCHVDILAWCAHYNCYLPIHQSHVADIERDEHATSGQKLLESDEALNAHFQQIIPERFRSFYLELGRWLSWRKVRVTDLLVLTLLYRAAGMSEEAVNDLMTTWTGIMQEGGDNLMSLYRALGYWMTYQSRNPNDPGYGKVNHFSELMRREQVVRAVLRSRGMQTLLSLHNI